jgi:hypothetical protein
MRCTVDNIVADWWRVHLCRYRHTLQNDRWNKIWNAMPIQEYMKFITRRHSSSNIGTVFETRWTFILLYSYRSFAPNFYHLTYRGHRLDSQYCTALTSQTKVNILSSINATVEQCNIIQSLRGAISHSTSKCQHNMLTKTNRHNRPSAWRYVPLAMFNRPSVDAASDIFLRSVPPMNSLCTKRSKWWRTVCISFSYT